MSDRQKNYYSIAVSSALASVIATFLANPFEVMKIRQQTGDFNCDVHPQSKVPRNFMYVHRVALIGNIKTPANSTYFADIMNEVFQPRRSIIKISTNPFVCTCLHNESMIKAFHHIYTTEGIQTFFNGWKYAIKQATVSNISYFIMYEKIKSSLEIQTTNRYTIPLISAFIARSLTTTITFPLEYWRVLQSSSIGYTTKKNFQLGSHITSAYMITLQRDIVFSCIFWVLLENAKSELTKQFKDSPKSIINLISGIFAGVTTASLTLPLDLIKTRKQVSTRTDLSSIPGKDDQKKTLHLIKSIIKQEGFQGLFKGYQPRMAKVTVHAGIVYMTYEYLKELINLKMKSNGF